MIVLRISLGFLNTFCLLRHSNAKGDRLLLLATINLNLKTLNTIK